MKRGAVTYLSVVRDRRSPAWTLTLAFGSGAMYTADAGTLRRAVRLLIRALRRRPPPR